MSIFDILKDNHKAEVLRWKTIAVDEELPVEVKWRLSREEVCVREDMEVTDGGETGVN